MMEGDGEGDGRGHIYLQPFLARKLANEMFP